MMIKEVMIVLKLWCLIKLFKLVKVKWVDMKKVCSGVKVGCGWVWED